MRFPSSASNAKQQGGIADGRRCCQIAAEGRAIPDQRRSEELQPLVDDFGPIGPPLADLRQRQAGADLDNRRPGPVG